MFSILLSLLFIDPVSGTQLPQAVEGKVNEVIQVELADRATTGYTWSLKGTPPEGVSVYQCGKDGETIPGKEGKLFYCIKSAVKAKFQLTFDLKRSWEDKPPVEQKVFEVVIVE